MKVKPAEVIEVPEPEDCSPPREGESPFMYWLRLRRESGMDLDIPWFQQPN